MSLSGFPSHRSIDSFKGRAHPLKRQCQSCQNILIKKEQLYFCWDSTSVCFFPSSLLQPPDMETFTLFPAQLRIPLRVVRRDGFQGIGNQEHIKGHPIHFHRIHMSKWNPDSMARYCSSYCIRLLLRVKRLVNLSYLMGKMLYKLVDYTSRELAILNSATGLQPASAIREK